MCRFAGCAEVAVAESVGGLGDAGPEFGEIDHGYGIVVGLNGRHCFWHDRRRRDRRRRDRHRRRRRGSGNRRRRCGIRRGRTCRRARRCRAAKRRADGCDRFPRGGWSFTLPQTIGRKPLGETSPVWEMNMTPRPSRMPSGERMPGRGRDAPPPIFCITTRRKWWPSVVFTAKGALPTRPAMSSKTRSMSSGSGRSVDAGAAGGDQQEHAPHRRFQLEHELFESLVFVDMLPRVSVVLICRLKPTAWARRTASMVRS